MRLRTALLTILPFAVVGGLLFVGCDTADDATGRVIVRMIDAPVEHVTAINVTVVECQVLSSADDSKVVIPAADDATDFNLLDLVGGNSLEVCDQTVEIGPFDQLRIVLGEDAFITIGDGQPEALHVASGTSAGLKFFFEDPVNLGGGLLDVTLDFVAEESVHSTGPPEAPTGYVMTPVIRVVSAEVNGSAATLVEEVPNPVQEI